MILPLPFDTNLFGYSVGKVLWTQEKNEKKILEEASGFQLVYIFSSHPLSFISKQVIHVDTKLTFSKRLENTTPLPEITSLRGKPEFINNPQLASQLQFLALESGTYSRFKTDPRLRKNEFEQLYQLWIQKAIAGENILIAPEMAGMITYDIQESNAQIGLIAVHPDHRRKSWGKKLLMAAEDEVLAQGAHTLLIPTQEANLPAVKLYTEMGYLLQERTYIYHYWKS
ncbi:GNAT family N-acetyltransferase [Algoriphagus litoralis]|uniref:GNAT family N-acetyltransferase n=1 Tax=Algoriphagus litoralis TaxID=2202829 RepID=UPI000DBA3B7D|nr:GNAT family N-acetyltransferase [Algoriphagus litoralis]